MTGRASHIDELQSQAPSALAFLFCGGGILVAFSTLLPGRPDVATALVASAMAVATAGVLVLLGSRAGPRSLTLFLGLGTILISVIVASGEGEMRPDALLYVWVGLYSGAFMSRRARLAHLAFVVIAFVTVMVATPDGTGGVSSGSAQSLLLLIGAVGVASAWSAHLRGLIDSLLASQRAIARTDTLTGLANRTELLLPDALQRHFDSSATLLLIDLDEFKSVNDTLGHEAGDELLTMTALRLRAAVGNLGLVARLGGDEFVVVLQFGDAHDVAERILIAIRRPYVLGEEIVHVSASIGVVDSIGRLGIEQALSDADLAMYNAKREGVGISFFETEMRAAAAERREITSDLRTALLEKQFSLRFQPILETDTGRIELFEALVRWEHPDKGLIGPDRFIPIAEATGLITLLGRWVLDDACRAAVEWTGPDAPSVSVNLSSRELLDASLVDHVQESLARHRLAPHRLLLEITETSVMTDPDRAIDVLHRLKALGVGLAIDDFGTGHSSLEYLRRLPACTLKLAQPFVRDLHTAPESLALARGIVSLAHAVGKRVVAEGVETIEQHEALRAMGCDLVQGYLFDRPLVEVEAAGRLDIAAHMVAVAS